MDKFPNWADHIVVSIFCILIPLQTIRQNLKSSSPVVYNSKQKLTLYFSTCISLFIMAAIIVSVWLLFQRPLAAIGFTSRVEGRWWIWTSIAFVILYAIDTINTVATPKRVAEAIDEWQKRTPFLPTLMKEVPAYLLLCVCAGVFEEIVYRGYMITYFEHLFTGLAYRQNLAVLVASFVFAISHFYQGVKSVIKIFVLSAFLGFIFVQSGSLVIVMLLHFVINVIGGLISIKFMGRSSTDEYGI
jgi:membrane protease YdiL (CAAX protease family)